MRERRMGEGVETVGALDRLGGREGTWGGERGGA